MAVDSMSPTHRLFLQRQLGLKGLAFGMWDTPRDPPKQVMGDDVAGKTMASYDDSSSFTRHILPFYTIYMAEGTGETMASGLTTVGCEYLNLQYKSPTVHLNLNRLQWVPCQEATGTGTPWRIVASTIYGRTLM